MEKLIEVHDNLIEPHIQDFCEKFLLSQLPGWVFDWCYMTNMTGDANRGEIPEIGFGKDFRGKNNKEIINNYHDILLSPLYNFVQSQKILISKVLNYRTYLQTPSPYHGPQSPHLDSLSPHFVCLYYVNDSDGDTIFYDENKKEFKRVSPKKGRVVFFDGSILHSGSIPSKSTRVVINYNFNYVKLSQ